MAYRVWALSYGFRVHCLGFFMFCHICALECMSLDMGG